MRHNRRKVRPKEWRRDGEVRWRVVKDSAVVGVGRWFGEEVERLSGSERRGAGDEGDLIEYFLYIIFFLFGAQKGR